MKSRSSMVIVGAATLLGLFFGNGMGSVVADLTHSKADSSYNLIMAVVLAAIAACGAYVAVTRYETAAASKTPEQTIQDPALARFLFADPRSAALWLPIRL